MLTELIGMYWWCPVCGRHHNREPLEYWWCPYCGSNVQSQINELKERIQNLEDYLKELDKEEDTD